MMIAVINVIAIIELLQVIYLDCFIKKKKYFLYSNFFYFNEFHLTFNWIS